ncbi:MAG: topoisomerase DNA-binding C4 zinc finger domain-containing protein, partial [Thermoplasmata archaeon]|nr:topoisomerase DNA-binding C4 zinc finger domain-containing protein [Thermoplasmata archaeon]
DLAWGAVLTRFISLTTGRMGREFLSVGRVQSPSLALVVDKENEILAFVAKPYWEVTAQVGKEDFRTSHVSNPFWEEIEAIRSSENARKAEEAKVKVWDVREESGRPPPPFNTTMFISEATKLGLGARQAMEIAEELYTEGWISYPRTDNTVYPRSIGLKGVLKKLVQSEFEEEAKELLAQPRIRATRGKTLATDHPPIYPVRGAKKTNLSGMKWRIYELVARRFMATVAPDAIYKVTNGLLDLNGEEFKGDGKVILSPGWIKYYPYIKIAENPLPSLSAGDTVPVNKVAKARKHTKPPNRYNQGSLIRMMEKLNLGTKSTRHEIIQKLFDRGYVRSPLMPTPMGMALVEMLKEGAEEMTHHQMTATLEEEMTAISKDEKELALVVDDSRKMLAKVLEDMEGRKEKVRSVMAEAVKEENHVGTCPVCGGDLMVLRPGKKRFVGCTNYPSCRNTYPLPQQGLVKATGKNCGSCGAPLVKILSKGKRPWEICLNMDCSSKNKKKTKA